MLNYHLPSLAFKTIHEVLLLNFNKLGIDIHRLSQRRRGILAKSRNLNDMPWKLRPSTESVRKNTMTLVTDDDDSRKHETKT